MVMKLRSIISIPRAQAVMSVLVVPGLFRGVGFALTHTDENSVGNDLRM